MELIYTPQTAEKAGQFSFEIQPKNKYYNSARSRAGPSENKELMGSRAVAKPPWVTHTPTPQVPTTLPG